MQFVAIPPYLAAGAAGFVVLMLFKKWGDKLNPKNSPIMDRVIDVMTALSAASVVGGLASTPLISSLRDIARLVFDKLGETTASAVGVGVNWLTVGLVLFIAYKLFMTYEEHEKFKDLMIFGIVMLVAATLFPYVGDAMSWWSTHVLVNVWNFLIWALDLLFKLQIRPAS
jgi:hypothetical protein